MRIGILGGSFDPIHLGHLQLARAVQKDFFLDKVFFVPSKVPPHKQTQILAGAADRINMISLAIKPYRSFSASRYEIDKRGMSYTYVTMRYFRKLYPRADIFFLMGSDSFNELSSWARIEQLMSLCTCIVVKRRDYPPRKESPYYSRVLFARNEIPDVSSSMIREFLKKGKSTGRMLPPRVSRYILRRRLYA